ncbi:MAG: hypothetical protein JXB04_09215 [Kiritimatiellae bacterium]|nr:hypothetical protein [Kiritimatiellia bacterium]
MTKHWLSARAGSPLGMLMTLLLLGGLLSGCARERADEAVAVLQEELAARDAALDKLGAQVEQMKAEHERRLTELDRTGRVREQESLRTIEAANRLVEEKNRRLAELEAALTRARARIAELDRGQAAARPAAATAAAEARSARAEPQIVPPARDEDLFPLRVFGIAGERVVTGTHTVTRQVETGEIYRDEYGQRRRKFEPREETREEYGYRVVFSIENLSAEPQRVSVRAGARTRELVVPPRGMLTDMSVDSAMGGALMVMVGGLSRSFPVAYVDEEP